MIAEIARFVRFARKVLIRVIISRMKYYKQVLAIESLQAITPDCMFNMGGNLIGAKTLDLNADFKAIAAQLDRIAEEFFGGK